MRGWFRNIRAAARIFIKRNDLNILDAKFGSQDVMIIKCIAPDNRIEKIFVLDSHTTIKDYVMKSIKTFLFALFVGFMVFAGMMADSPDLTITIVFASVGLGIGLACVSIGGINDEW